ncbi:MAG TPA: efflux RND transporter periplasmic adaptor subunit [Candidatus Udaeobacter sp.]|nr:efflux RND transporter periplasmic adaptor subunit [Candidatus Udaeobacter sp.]
MAKPISNVRAQSTPRPRRRWRSVALAICLLIGIGGFVFGIKILQIGKMMSTPMVMPPTTVSSAVAKEEDWAPTLSAIGSVSAVQGAVVSTELGGVVAEIEFQNGGVAKKGDVLMRLDSSAEEAQLHTAEADLELARANLERIRNLAAQKVVSKQELDAAQSTFGQKQGAVDNMRAFITKKQVRAPFDGMLGIRQVNVGQMINSGQQVVQLTALDKVYVDLALPQQTLPELATGYEARVHADGLLGHEFKGKVSAINSMVDPVTRNVGVQATLENPDHALHPGMFVKVDVILPQKSKTLVIPGSAVSYAPYGNSVFVIEKKKDPKTGKESESLRQAFVRIGEARGDFVAITEGLKAGDVVVSTGVFKLRNGMAVVINNDLAPKPQLNPKPVDS